MLITILGFGEEVKPLTGGLTWGTTSTNKKTHLVPHFKFFTRLLNPSQMFILAKHSTHAKLDLHLTHEHDDVQLLLATYVFGRRSSK